MMKLCIVILTIAISFIVYAKMETNESWKQCEQIVKSYDIFYDNLAVTVEDASNKQKRAFSIVISGILNYISTGDKSAIVDVDQPADVIASDMRRQLSLGRMILDPMISIVKRACPPTATQNKCKNTLAIDVQEHMKKCDGFAEHLKFYKLSTGLYNDEDAQKLIKGMVTFSRTCVNDREALDFVNDVNNGMKYKAGVTKFMNWYAAYANGAFKCNLPPIECDGTDK